MQVTREQGNDRRISCVWVNGGFLIGLFSYKVTTC
nr:MAG TPA: hypothetical protein [Caudoviricetes sp.]